MKLKELTFGLLFCMGLLACGGDKETKTLYGSWEPLLEYNERDQKWQPADENYFISISGKCENIEIAKQVQGDLANPEIPLEDPHCFGNRDEVSWKDQTYGYIYHLKMDASKDTLIGSYLVNPGEEDEYAIKTKFLRIH